MPTPRLTAEQLALTVRTYSECGDIRSTAKALDLSYTATRHRLMRAGVVLDPAAPAYSTGRRAARS